MLRMSRVLFAFLALMLLPLAALAQEDQSADPALLTLLAYVPQSATQPSNDERGNIIEFSDLAAHNDLLGMNLMDATFGARVIPTGYIDRTGIIGSQQWFVQYENMEPLVGFTLPQVGQMMTWGVPPSTATVYRGEFDEDAISEALRARDFDAEDREGFTFFSRGEDGEIDVSQREPADPFGGDLGRSARVAVYDDLLVYSPVSALLRTITTAQANDAALADVPGWETLARALYAKDSDVLRAWLFPPLTTLDLAVPATTVISVTGEPESPFLDSVDLSGWGALPPPRIAALADREENGEHVHLIAAVYADAATAQLAADELAARLPTFETVPGDFESVNVRFDDPLVVEGDGAYVAVAALRYPSQYGVIDEETDMPARPGIIFHRWIQSVLQRTFIILATDTDLIELPESD
ncbi:MAG: hypothetical protein ACLFTK_12015 [Anaerolineales bacterium]